MMDDLREARRLAEIYRKLRTKGGTLESTTGSEPLNPEQVKATLGKELAKGAAEVDGEAALDSAVDESEVATAATDLMAAAEHAMEKAEAHNEAALTDFEFAALEAIVHLVGRPAVRYTDNRIRNLNDDGDNSRWSSLIVTARKSINAISASVGRVGIAQENAPDTVIGTAWRLGEDLVVTNRHVAARLVTDKTLDPSAWLLDTNKECVVDFNATDGAQKNVRFPIAKLVYCAPEEYVDLAILQLNAGGAALPAALQLEWDLKAIGQTDDGVFTSQEIYVVGHPYKPLGGDNVLKVFGNADGLKRWSPGLVTELPDGRPTFEHDCSTLGGNSGSAVLSVLDHAVVGIHYRWLGPWTDDVARANAALALSRMGGHPAVQILKQGHA